MPESAPSPTVPLLGADDPPPFEIVNPRGVAPVVFSVHSFTPVMNGFARPWHVGILWDKDPRVPVPLISELAAADPRRIVGDNEPYSEREEPTGYSVRTHAVPAGLPHAGV